MVDLMLVRHLPPWHANVGKRLVKSPQVYIRDAGLTHALLGLETREALLGHPVVGGSWEGFCIENLIAAAPRDTEASFYRSSAGAEIDLILKLPDHQLWAIEVNRTTAPKVTRGFHIAADDLGVASGKRDGSVARALTLRTSAPVARVSAFSDTNTEPYLLTLNLKVLKYQIGQSYGGSGGPLFTVRNGKGAVIGMQFGQTRVTAENYNYAIKTSGDFLDFLSQNVPDLRVLNE